MKHPVEVAWRTGLVALLASLGSPALAAWAPSRAVSRGYAQGVAALDVGELDEAETLFRGVLEDEPDCGQARHALGLALLRQNRKAEALGAMEQAAAENPEVSDAWVGLSLAAFASQDFPRARQAGETAVSLDAASLEAQVALQEALLRGGELGAARSALVEARGALRSADLACLEAQVDVEAGDLDGAVARLELCREGTPALAVAIDNQVAAATGQVAQAGRLAARMGLSATSGVARALDAWSSGEHEEALVALDEVLELEPSRADARLLRGRVRSELGDAEGAVADLEAALGGDAWVDVAWTGAMSGVVRQSQEEDLQRRVAEGAALLVRILARDGDPDLAAERLADARAELGDRPELAAAEADLTLSRGDAPGAWVALRRGLPAGQSSETWLDAAARLVLSAPSNLTDDVAEALRSSESWTHRYNLGVALRTRGEDARVLALAETAWQSPAMVSPPEAAGLFAQMGHEAAVNTGSLEEANRWLERVAPPHGARAVARFNHAVMRLNAGEHQGALEVLPRHSELGPEAESMVRTISVQANAGLERWAEAVEQAEGANAQDRYWLATVLLSEGELGLGYGLLEGTCEQLQPDAAARCSQLMAEAIQ